MRGVLLIALGHVNYFKMAETLAVSLKSNDPDLQIAVVTEGNRLIDSSLFDKAIICPKQYYTHKGKVEYLKAKVHMYDLSPFDETIFLDVDQIALPGRRISDLFGKLKDVNLTFSNEGPSDYSQWADVVEVVYVYGPGEFWNFHSELVYFKKGKSVKEYFNKAKRIYTENKLKSVMRFSGGQMADELAFQIASMQTGLYPHKENWLPNFWHRRDKINAYAYPYQLKQYYTYSIGGNANPPHVAGNYNNLAAFYYSKQGLQNPYKARDKRSFLPERQKY
jgi:hypothetical protein